MVFSVGNLNKDDDDEKRLNSTLLKSSDLPADRLPCDVAREKGDWNKVHAEQRCHM